MELTPDLLTRVIENLPAGAARDFAAAYLPVLARAAIADARAAFELWLGGNQDAARALVLAHMTADEFDADNARFTAADAAHGLDNAARVLTLRKVAQDAAAIAIAILLALVGL